MNKKFSALSCVLLLTCLVTVVHAIPNTAEDTIGDGDIRVFPKLGAKETIGLHRL